MASCCPCLKSSSYYDQFDKLTGSEWKLVQKDDKAFASAAQSYTIAFTQDKMVSGMGECNRFSGVMLYSVTKSEQKFSINQIASTRMSCVDAVGENEYFEFLKTAHNVQIDGELMMMLANDAAGKTHRWVFEQIKK